MKIRLAYCTDRGKRREKNEDLGCAHDMSSISVNVAAVADGVGGYSDGEIASRLAIEVVERRIGELQAAPDSPKEFLESVVQECNQCVYQAAQRRGGEMKTTLTVGLLVDTVLSIAHVGDGRVYCITRKKIRKITNDHLWVREQILQGNITEAEAETSQYRNTISRSVGNQRPPEIDSCEELVRKGQTYLFCTDGLHGYVDEDTIHSCLRRRRSIKRLGRDLIKLANKAGGADNITVALLKIK